jgi:N-formylglutamate amidohydrolase
MRGAFPALAVALLAGCALRSDPAGPEQPARQPVHEAGKSYFGRDGYVEYIAGNSPVIITAPHGGELAPAEIPDRGCGTTVTDLATEQLARAFQFQFHRQTGRYPHVIINRLKRSKMDANRDRAEAACGNARADTAWHEYHRFVDAARAAVLASEGTGFYLDLHGHGHANQRLELGYLVPGAAFDRTDAALDADAALRDSSSIATMARRSGFAALLRGPASLGALFAAEGYPAVPGPADPSPRGEPYFSGGYSTERHGCARGGTICGVQIEANQRGVRDSEANRLRFAAATVRVLESYLATHLAVDLTP